MKTSTYPHAPGSKTAHPETSQQAAAAVPATLRDRVFDYFKGVGHATADEAAQDMGETVLSVRPRFSELRRLGLIEDTGVRRLNRSNRAAAVWRVSLAKPQPLGQQEFTL